MPGGLVQEEKLKNGCRDEWLPVASYKRVLLNANLLLTENRKPEKRVTTRRTG